ncbi:MAG: YjgB family protein [Alicyclobacillus sp.]|nr:YjgB family protein [Alicyclobacillus sp.]
MADHPTGRDKQREQQTPKPTRRARREARAWRRGIAVWGAVAAVSVGGLVVAGCSQPATSGGNTANAVHNTVVGGTGTGQNVTGTTVTNAVSAGQNTATGLNTAGAGSAGNAGTQGGSLRPLSAQQQLVQQTMAAARQGQVPGIPFTDQSNISDVQQAWGAASQQNEAGAGTYATYNSRHAAFGLNKGEQIFDVRSYAANFQKISYSDIVRVLGNPGTVRQTSDSYIYLYPAGPDYQLLWVFPKLKDGSRGATVDHVSVFWPQGTVNSMAATQPAPGIVINNPPGQTGSLFTFSIQHPPKGYTLEELEWIPANGAASAVVNTFTQAVNNGQSGNLMPGFNISGDGQTLSFVYPASMKGQSGVVRVIYQAPSGEAMIGESSAVQLR